MEWRARSRPHPSPIPRELLDRAETLTGALATLSTGFPAFECLIFVDRHRSERRLTVSALWGQAGEVQAALMARGFRRGQVALLVLPTSPELVAAYLGTIRAGGIPGLVAPPSNRFGDRRLYAAYVDALLRHSAAQTLYCDAEVADVLRSETPHLERMVVLTPEDVAPTGALPSAVTASPDDITTVQYSSGSTGAQKGVLLSHDAMLNNIRAVRDGLGLTPHDVSVNWIPLYHDMGLIDAFLLPLLSGCPTVLIPTMDFMREPSLWLWAVHHYAGTVSWAPNFAYALCATRIPDSDLVDLDLSSWRIAINAAEPVLARTLSAFTERFAAYGFRPEAMTPAWGLAENVTIATAQPVDERPRVETIDRQVLTTAGVACPTAGGGLASVAIGRCLPHAEVQIRDAQARPVLDRHVGNVWLRTNSLLARYHNDPAATARVLVDGWLDTGDCGYTAEGSLYFISREKDLIVIGGEKYAPHDLEAVIDRIPGVRQGCAVAFGVLNETRGTEDVAVVVETRETDETAHQRLREAIRAEVTRATGLGLRHVILVPPGGVEKTTSGKLARRATYRRYAELLTG